MTFRFFALDLNAAETRGHGSTLMAITCKGGKNTLKEDAIKAAVKNYRDKQDG